jgi:hypothetical protein
MGDEALLGSEDWRGRLQSLFYVLIFQPVPKSIVHDLVYKALPRGTLGPVTPDELRSDIDEALASGEPLAPLDQADPAHTEPQLREFLQELRRTLDEAFPP